MKTFIVSVLIGLSTMTLLTGCIGLSFGGGTHTRPVTPTVGQQMIDLQMARDSGAITESEYQAQKAKILKEH